MSDTSDGSPMTRAATLNVMKEFLLELWHTKRWLLVWLLALTVALVGVPVALVIVGDTADVRLGCAWLITVTIIFVINSILVSRKGKFTKILGSTHLPGFIPLGIWSLYRNFDPTLTDATFALLIYHNIVNWIGVGFDVNDTFQYFCRGVEQ